MIQQFIHTIAKEEIAKLTVEEFKGRIITILSKEEADKAPTGEPHTGRQQSDSAERFRTVFPRR